MREFPALGEAIGVNRTFLFGQKAAGYGVNDIVTRQAFLNILLLYFTRRLFQEYCKVFHFLSGNIDHQRLAAIPALGTVYGCTYLIVQFMDSFVQNHTILSLNKLKEGVVLLLPFQSMSGN